MEKEGFVGVLEMKGEGLEAEEEEDVEGSWGWRRVCPVAQATIAILFFFFVFPIW